MRFVYHFKQFIVILGDVLAFALGLVAAFSLRTLAFPQWWQIRAHLALFGAVFFLWLLVNFINGLYDLGAPRRRENTKRFIEAAGFSLALGIAFFYVVPGRNLTPKTILVLTVVFGYLFSYFWRLMYHRLIGANTLRQRVLLLGVSPETDEIVTITKNRPESGFEIAALLDPSCNIKNGQMGLSNVYHKLSALRPAITTHKIQTVVVAPHLQDSTKALTELYQLLFWPVAVMDVAAFYENLTGRIPPSTFSESWFLKNLTNTARPVYDKARLLFDYFFALLGGALLIALLPAVGAAIKLNSKGPVFYTQKRVGQYGDLFTIYKFRTMYALADDGSAEPAGARFATKDDERVTWIGKLLRKTRLDELPQVINIFKGNISVIGPRPERPEIVEQLEAKMPYYPLRHVVKPGLTGWAVLHQNYTDTLETSLQKLQYDLYYIKNRSLLLDLSILLRTVNLVVRLMGQ